MPAGNEADRGGGPAPGYFTDFRCLPLALARVRTIWNHLNRLLVFEAERMNHNAEANIAAIASSANAVMEMPESPFRKSKCQNLYRCRRFRTAQR